MTPAWRRFLPQTISLYLTYRCRSRCAHCFLVDTGKIDRHELSVERCIDIIDEAREQRVYMLVLSGGEPLLHPGFARVVGHARASGLLPLIGITGDVVTDADIATLRTHGIPTVQVSLDGATEASNDAIRGAGSFMRVTRAIAKLQQAGLKVNLALTVHRHNWRETEAMLELGLRLRVARVKLGFYVRSGPASVFAELTPFMKRTLLQSAAHFMSTRASDDWIACPTHDVASGREIRPTRRAPPLIIGADGELTTGEWGERIGTLSSGSLTDQYSAFVHRKQQSFFERTVDEVAARYGISSIRGVDGGLGANALIYAHDGQLHIVFDRALPAPLRFFTILHEIGHVATQTMSADPRRHASALAERAANLWALDHVGEHIADEARADYRAAAVRSDAALYELIGQRLDRDLVNYWH